MSILTPGKQWVAHAGKRSRLRELSKICKPFLKPDSPAAEAIQKIRDHIGGGPFSEYGVLMILYRAIEISDSATCSLTEAIEIMLASLEDKKEPENVSRDSVDLQ